MSQLMVDSPVVIKEIGGEGLDYFNDVSDFLLDRFDHFWGDRYEGWDARGRRFEIARKSPPARWWQRLMGMDPSFLEIACVDGEPDARIRSLLIADLESELAPAEHRMQHTIADLMRIGLHREARRKSGTTLESLVDTLLNSPNDAWRDDAAEALARWPNDVAAEEALLSAIASPKLDDSLRDTCTESLATIWIARGHYPAEALDSLEGDARFIADEYLRSAGLLEKRPER